MKILINSKVTRILPTLLCLLGPFFAGQMTAMQIGAGLYGKQNPIAAKKIAAKQRELIINKKLSQLAPDEGLVCQQGTAYCISVNKEIIKLSQSLAGLLEDLGDDGLAAIPIDSPIADIKNSFDVIKIYADCLSKKLSEDEISIKIKTALAQYSADQLIGIWNCHGSLLYPEIMFNACWDSMKEYISDAPNVFYPFQRLKPYLQESLFTLKSINQLKKLIIKKYLMTRKTELGIQNPEQIPGQTTWSPDGNKICTVQPSVINMWDITNPKSIKKIKYQAYDSYEPIGGATFSPDNKKIAFVAGSHTLQVWDVNKEPSHVDDPIARLSERFIDSRITFTQDGTRILFTKQDDGILYGWDFINKTFTKPQKYIISTDFHSINSIVLNPAKKTTIAVGCQANSNNILALCNISTLTNITVLKEGIFESPIAPIAFSQNGKMIVSRPQHKLDQLIINNVDNNIFNESTSLKLDSQGITTFPAFESAEFSPDNDFIIASVVPNADDYKNSKLTLWDISDPKNPSYEILDSGFGVSVAPSSDGSCRIAFSTMDLANVASVRVWTLWTAQDLNSINSLKLCTPDQKRLIYDICLKSLLSLNREQSKAFLTLPIGLQELLMDLLPELSLSTYEAVPSKFLLPQKLEITEKNESEHAKGNWFWNWLISRFWQSKKD